jgi:hypothetical protein
MRPLLVALAILATPLLAQEPGGQQIPEEKTGESFDPTALEGRILRGEPDAPTVSVRLREGGVLEVQAGNGWTEVTLEELGAFLAKSREDDDRAQQRIGKSGLEKGPLGMMQTRLFLSLQADPNVPWQHLRWVLWIATEQKYRKLGMSEGARRLLVYMPVSANVNLVEPPLGIGAYVDLLARAEQPARWGDREVPQPTEVRFKCGSKETGDLADVASYLREMKKVAAGVKERRVVFFAEIRPQHRVPYARVFDVMETVVAEKVPAVDLGAAIPPKAVRDARRLPYVPSDHDTEEPQVPEEQVVDEVGHDLSEDRIVRGERDAPAVFVRIREGGVLEWKYGEEWREKTLEDLGTILDVARDRYELSQRPSGKSVLDELPRNKDLGIFLSIEADPGVPWQHVEWVITIAMERKIRRLEMSEGTRRLLASVPRDAAIEYAEGYKPPRTVDIHAVVRAERPAKWGDSDVSRPTEVRYRCGDTETADLAEVTAYLRKVKAEAENGKEGEVALVGEIKAGYKVPYANVFDLMEAFVAADLTTAGFYGTAIPPEAVRSAKRLPYPAKNYDGD